MIASTQITNAEVLFINRKDKIIVKNWDTFSENSKYPGRITAKLKTVTMWKFQDAFETRKRSSISAFSICITVPLNLSALSIIS